MRRNGRGGLGGGGGSGDGGSVGGDGLGVCVVVLVGFGVVDVGKGVEDGSAPAGGLEGAGAEGVAVDVGEDEVEGAGNAAFFGAAFEATEDEREAEGRDELGFGGSDEVECVGEGFAAVEG